MHEDPTRTDDAPDDRTAPDGDGSSGEDSSVAGGDEPVEAAASFLAEREPDDYPSVVRITARPAAEHRAEAAERLAHWQAGESVPHVVNFQAPSDLRALLTDRRVELLRSVMADRPASIRALAERLDRDVKSVHDDLAVLGEYDLVLFEQDGRAKQPVVPYETIEVRLDITAGET